MYTDDDDGDEDDDNCDERRLTISYQQIAQYDGGVSVVGGASSVVGDGGGLPDSKLPFPYSQLLE